MLDAAAAATGPIEHCHDLDRSLKGGARKASLYY
jgi:hypothetical protein